MMRLGCCLLGRRQRKAPHLVLGLPSHVPREAVYWESSR